MRYMRELVDEGFVGTPFIFNGYEQNSQWLDPQNAAAPGRSRRRPVGPAGVVARRLRRADHRHRATWCVGADLAQVVGTMRNFIPERMVRATGRMMRMNIDDGDIFIGEFANGAIGSIQTSFVTVGNYPGIEARIYGSKGALICRLVEEYGICETLKVGHARPGRVPRARDPGALLSAGRARARVVAHAVLRQPDQQLHRRDPERRRRATRATSTTARGCRKSINAVERSFRERRWVTLPLA